jgi:hypothetical protein
VAPLVPVELAVLEVAVPVADAVVPEAVVEVEDAFVMAMVQLVAPV